MARRSAFGNIRRLPSGRYQARYEVAAGQSATAPTTFTTRGEAESWLARERVRIESAAAGSPKARVRPPRLDEYWSQWITDRDLRPSTRRSYRNYWHRHIEPVLGHLRLDEITPAVIRDWHRNLAPDAPTVRARTYATVRTVFGTAVDDELIAANPCRIRGAGNAKTATEVEVLTPAQVSALAHQIGPDWSAAVLLGAWCQLRAGEVLALRRRDVDLEARTVYVRRGVTWDEGQPVFGPPKTAAGVRAVGIPAAIVPALAGHLDRVRRGRDALLFTGRTDDVPPKLQTFGDRVKRAARRAELPATFRFHHLRHTGLTALAEAGASVAELQARAGHTTPNMALRYQHARAERDRDLADRLSVLMEGSR